MSTRTAWAALAIAAAACSKGARVPSAATANEAVPDAWKDKIEFATTTQVVPSGAATFSVPTPKGWPRWQAPNLALEPADVAGIHVSPTFGQMVQMGLFANCSGQPRDGAASAAAADRDRFAIYHNGGRPTATVVKDDRQPSRRVMVVRDDHALQVFNGPQYVRVEVDWWPSGPSRCYWGCYADLAVASAALAPAFEQACLSAKVVE